MKNKIQNKFILFLTLVCYLFNTVSADAFLLRGGGTPGHVYLPTVSSSPLVVYGTYRMISGYNGALFRLQRVSDGATMDIFPNTDDSPNVSGVAAWLGAATFARVDTRYDQLGSGNNEVQTTSTLCPFFNLNNAVNGIYSVTFNSSVAHLDIPAAITGNSRNFTTVSVYNYESTNAATLGVEGAAYNTTGALTSIPGQTFKNTPQVLTSLAFLSTAHPSGRSQTQVMITASGASNIAVYVDGTTASVSANQAGTWAGGMEGFIKSGFQFIGENYAHIVYPTQLSSSDAATLQAYLNPLYKVITGAKTQLVWAGNSIVQGTQATFLQNNQRQMEPQLSKQIYISNQGVFGQLASTEYTNISYYTSQFNAGLTQNLMVAPEATNDLDNTASGSIVGAGTTYYNNYIVPFVQAAQAAGFTVFVPTMLPRNWSGSPTDISQKNTEQAAYNALVTGNAATYNYTVVDYASIPQMSNPSNATYYADGTHPTSAGYLLMANLFASILNPILAANDNHAPVYAANDNYYLQRSRRYEYSQWEPKRRLYGS